MTRLEYLQTLPEPYRTQAIENAEKLNDDPSKMLNEQSSNVRSALIHSFVWGKSEQGHAYWSIFYRTYKPRQRTASVINTMTTIVHTSQAQIDITTEFDQPTVITINSYNGRDSIETTLSIAELRYLHGAIEAHLEQHSLNQ